MSKASLGISAALISIGSPLSVAWAQQPDRDQAMHCSDLGKADFSGVADASTQITSTQLIAATGTEPAYCMIAASIDQRIGIDTRLPMNNWNAKFMEVGCGGWCGAIRNTSCRDPLRLGYAYVASDMGHKGSAIDVRWADKNLQGQIDFGYRATHVAAVAGKAIAAQFYGSPPKRSYFDGCSTGGYQGVIAAQRFPWDFDGIIGNPFGCKFKPQTLRCKPGTTSGCLSDAQVKAANKVYSGPMNSAGQRTSTGSFLIGSELGWGFAWPTQSIEDFFRYGLPGFSVGPDWKYTDFDLDRDYRRFGLAPHFDNGNPDLRSLKAAGGKLIVYHGTTDTIDPPAPVIDYYETVERTMGGRKSTQEFFRLFLIPGMNHCLGGPGALEVDWIHILEDWVERGKSPDVIVGTHPSRPNEPGFTRPLFPYPAFAKYEGRGGANLAGNFVPVSGPTGSGDR
jgi:feruloyl esterase